MADIPATSRRILNVRQFAQEVKVSPFSVYRLVEAGTLPAYRVGKAIRIDADEALESLRTGKEE